MTADDMHSPKTDNDAWNVDKQHMKRKPVTSSMIASVGYKPETIMLEIEFRSTGFVYQYFNVPEMEFRKLMSADSLGRYFNKNIKDDYRCVQIR